MPSAPHSHPRPPGNAWRSAGPRKRESAQEEGESLPTGGEGPQERHTAPRPSTRTSQCVGSSR